MTTNKKKKSRRVSQMTGMLSLLAVLLVLYLAVSSLSSEDGEETGQESETDGTAIADVAEEDIRRIEKTYNGETLAFVRENGIWYYEEDREFPLTQQFLEDMADQAASLTAERTLQGDEVNLEEFGLADPDLAIRITTKDGKEYGYEVGKENAVTGAYYMKKEAADDVYLISETVFYYYTDSLYDMCEMDPVPSVANANVEGITIYDGTDRCILERTQEEKTDDEGNVSVVNHWTMTGKGQTAAEISEDKANKAVSAALALKNEGGIDYKGDKTGLAVYGLEEHWGSVTIRYVENAETGETDENGNPVTQEEHPVFTIYFGDDYGESFCYGKLSDSNMVFLVDKEKALAAVTSIS